MKKYSPALCGLTLLLSFSVAIAEDKGKPVIDAEEEKYPPVVNALMARMEKLSISKNYSFDAMLVALGISDASIDEGGFGEAGGMRGWGKSFRIHYRYRLVVQMSPVFELGDSRERGRRVSTVRIGFIENPMEAMWDQTEQWITPYWSSGIGMTDKQE